MLFMVSKEDLKNCRYTSGYGPRWGDIHRGIDIGMPQKTKIYAPLDGKVIYNKTNNGGSHLGYGHYLVLYHEKEKLYTLYAHLCQLSHLKVGTTVKAGEYIALSGNTGRSTGPHLHFEIHEKDFKFKAAAQSSGKDTAVDPVKYYPQLKQFLEKNLASLVIPKKEEPKKEENTMANTNVEIVKFSEKWQETMFFDTLKNLEQKGALKNSDDWTKKYREGKLTVSEFALLALVMADRD